MVPADHAAALRSLHALRLAAWLRGAQVIVPGLPAMRAHCRSLAGRRLDATCSDSVESRSDFLLTGGLMLGLYLSVAVVLLVGLGLLWRV